MYRYQQKLPPWRINLFFSQVALDGQSWPPSREMQVRMKQGSYRPNTVPNDLFNPKQSALAISSFSSVNANDKSWRTRTLDDGGEGRGKATIRGDGNRRQECVAV